MLKARSQPQGGPQSRGNKAGSKVQKQAKKERLRQKRKRIAAAAAAAGSTEDAEILRERNLKYYVETAKADANVQKLMREVLLPVVLSRPAAQRLTVALLAQTILHSEGAQAC